MASAVCFVLAGCASSPPPPAGRSPRTPGEAAGVETQRQLTAARAAFGRGELIGARSYVAHVASRTPERSLPVAARDLTVLIEAAATSAAVAQELEAHAHVLRQELRRTQAELAKKDEALKRIAATVVGRAPQ